MHVVWAWKHFEKSNPSYLPVQSLEIKLLTPPLPSSPNQTPAPERASTKWAFDWKRCLGLGYERLQSVPVPRIQSSAANWNAVHQTGFLPCPSVTIESITFCTTLQQNCTSTVLVPNYARQSYLIDVYFSTNESFVKSIAITKPLITVFS